MLSFHLQYLFHYGSTGFHTIGAMVLAYQSQNCSSGQKTFTMGKWLKLKKKVSEGLECMGRSNSVSYCNEFQAEMNL